MEQVNALGVRADGSSEIVGTAPMPPMMKMREVVRNYFGEPDDADPMACDEATMCMAALEDYHCWIVAQGWQPPPFVVTPNAEASGARSASAGLPG